MICNNYTINEIMQQPSVWVKTFDLVMSQRDRILKFMQVSGFNRDSEIILTGAGSSAFIADAAVCLYINDGYRNARAIATTDIVSTPDFYLTPGKKFVISFGRSGNSPESMATYNIINEKCPGSAQFIITCNEDGLLAKEANSPLDYVLSLPKETNDKSLAMTSSFSTMLLASILVKNIFEIEKEGEKVKAAAAFASRFITDEMMENISNISKKNIKRAVFLGSGPLKGIACECHLKLQELTDGGIMCAYDSFMGLRHGPKAVINDETLVVYLLSDDEYTHRYEKDLISQINLEHRPAAQIVVSSKKTDYEGRIDFSVEGQSGELQKGNEHRYIPYVLIGQLLGYRFSLERGLNPDSPSVSGTISRVVSGVKIYNYR